MICFVVALLTSAGLTHGSRINTRPAAGSDRTLSITHEDAANGGSWIFAFRAMNHLGQRLGGAVVEVSAPSMNKQTCTGDNFGLICLKVSDSITSLQIKATAPTCTDFHRTIEKGSNCGTDSQRCLVQGVLSGFGNNCGGTGLKRGDSEDRAFCENALKSGSHTCTDWVEPVWTPPAPSPTPVSTPTNPTPVTGDEECPRDLHVAGEEVDQSAFMGHYTNIGEGGPNQGGRHVYRHNDHNYLYYWKPYGAWCIGDDYNTASAGMLSPLFASTWCPAGLTSWRVSKNGEFLPSPLTVTEEAADPNEGIAPDGRAPNNGTAPDGSSETGGPSDATTGSDGTQDNSAISVNSVPILLSVLLLVHWH